MIIKGSSCAGARRLAIHLTRLDTNERADVKEIRGVVSDSLYGALREMEAVGAGARTGKPFYHASINPRAGEKLSEEQREIAVDRLEKELGLTGQPRVVVVHDKKDREHIHIVWSRIDTDRMAAISDSHNYRKHEKVARELERLFGHERVQGAHAEREGRERPERTPSHSEMLQGDRTGIGAKEAREYLTGVWNRTKNGKEFRTALDEDGWTLARGDRRDYVAIDPLGGIHSIARRIAGVRVADIRKRFSDIDPRELPSVIQAKQGNRKRDPATALRFRLRAQGAKPKPAPAQGGGGKGPHDLAAGAAGKSIRPSRAVVDSLFLGLLGEKPAPKPRPPLVQENTSDAEAQRRQVLRQELSGEVPAETQRDAEIELRRQKDRDRGRGR